MHLIKLIYKKMDSFKSIFFCTNKISILLYFFIFFSLTENTNGQSNRLYPKMIDLPNDKFLFIIVDGIYIFESNLLDNIKIYNFKGQQIIDQIKDINKTTLSDITYNDNLYVFCLVKDYLYLFDNNEKKIIKELDLSSYLNGKSYSLNPFINATYLSCIISYTERTNYQFIYYDDDYIYKLNLYEINFINVDENNQEYFISKREYFNRNYVESNGISFISRDASTCEISFNILYCFYFVEYSEKVRVSGFELSNNYEEINYNDIFEEEGNIELYEIKSFNPSNSDLIFLCYYGLFYISLNELYYDKDYYIQSHCISYNIQEKQFYSIGNTYYINCNNFQPYYFEETNQYILGCSNYNELVKTFLFDGDIDNINNDYLAPLICNDIYNYLIYYIVFILFIILLK